MTLIHPSTRGRLGSRVTTGYRNLWSETTNQPAATCPPAPSHDVGMDHEEPCQSTLPATAASPAHMRLESNPSTHSRHHATFDTTKQAAALHSHMMLEWNPRSHEVGVHPNEGGQQHQQCDAAHHVDDRQIRRRGPGTARCRLPRHRMPCDSSNEGSKCVSMTRHCKICRPLPW
jgi:hypothetical protein